MECLRIVKLYWFTYINLIDTLQRKNKSFIFQETGRQDAWCLWYVSTDLCPQRTCWTFVVLKDFSYKTAYHQKSGDVLPFDFKLTLHYWSGMQPSKKSPKEAVLHFGASKLFLRLTTFWSASALPEVNTAMRKSPQRLHCQARPPALKQHWLHSFQKH